MNLTGEKKLIVNFLSNKFNCIFVLKYEDKVNKVLLSVKKRKIFITGCEEL